jgi:hypothetical protein
MSELGKLMAVKLRADKLFWLKLRVAAAIA